MGNAAEPVAPARRGNRGSALSGGPLARSALLRASAGTAGGLLFAAIYLIEGVTRPGYDPWQQPISSLSLGPGGWVQQLNFVVFGVLLLVAAYGWRQVLQPGRGALGFPLLEAVTGLGLIVDGVFSQDPVPGYPPGAIRTATLHGTIHGIFAIVTITALAVSCFVFAWRLAAEPGWRGWVAYSVLTGVLTIVLIAIFGAETARSAPTAGLYERLATGIHSVWGVLLLARLWSRTRLLRSPDEAPAG